MDTNRGEQPPPSASSNNQARLAAISNKYANDRPEQAGVSLPVPYSMEVGYPPANGPTTPSELPRARPLPIPLARPIVTQILVGINVLVWIALTLYASLHYHGNLIDVLTGSDNSGALDHALLDFGALANVCVAGPNVGPIPLDVQGFTCIGAGQWWRLFTAMFLHIGILHVGLNSWALYLLGREAEQLYGRLRFLIIYLLAGLTGSVASMTVLPALTHVSAGASGAIFGIIGVLLAYYLRYRNQLGAAGRAQLYNIALIAALNLFLSSQIPNIDNWAHLGGLIGGTTLGLLLAPSYQVVWDSQRGPLLADRLTPTLQLAVGGGYILLLGLFFAIGLQRLGS
jgi:rhomboid protease GluP